MIIAEPQTFICKVNAIQLTSQLLELLTYECKQSKELTTSINCNGFCEQVQLSQRTGKLYLIGEEDDLEQLNENDWLAFVNGYTEVWGDNGFKEFFQQA